MPIKTKEGLMPRPRKFRRVCGLPPIMGLVPVYGTERLDRAVWLTVDEYEAIRLIDNEGLSQEECGLQMQIARSTAQLVYDGARKKLAKALVEGLPLAIGGGPYNLCRQMGPGCGRRGCFGGGGRGAGLGRAALAASPAVGAAVAAAPVVAAPAVASVDKKDKEGAMTVAIPLDLDKRTVCSVFGRTPFFGFFSLGGGEGRIVANPAVDAQGGAGIQAARFVVDNGAGAVVTFRCGENAAAVFAAAGIAIHKASVPDAQGNLALLSEGKLPRLESFHPGFVHRQ